MTAHKMLSLLLSLCFWSHLAFAVKPEPPNGSSGVGNRTALNKDFALNMLKDAIQVLPTSEGSKVVDGKTDEVLLTAKPISRDQLSKFGKNLVRSKLGTIDGFEFVPEQNGNGSKQRNFWVTCPERGSCLMIQSVSQTNPKGPAAIGTLSK